MEIRYSKHLEFRITIRGIPYELPRIVFNSPHHFRDIQTNHYIAVEKVAFSGKERNMMVAYRKHTDYVLLITIHPLKKDQLENRLKTGRWKKL